MLNSNGASICGEVEPVTPGSPMNNLIELPEQRADLHHVSIDVGGSLAKVVWFTRSQLSSRGGKLNFHKFETTKIEACVDFVCELLDRLQSEFPGAERVVHATGGGAHKYYDLLNERIGGVIHKTDEMECLINGLNFLVREIPSEVFTYDERRPEATIYESSSKSDTFPYLLVNIGSGVSILKVTSDDTFERVSGTSLGGGTLWGLLSLLTDAQSYEDMLLLSKSGDNKNVDMLVGDIYGGSYNKIGLKATTIASSFGKVFKATKEERSEFKQEDISASLLYLVSNNIGQIAYLNAQAHGIQNGFFISGHPITMNTLSYAINFWSKGSIKALFLRHEGYLGAVGSFLAPPPSSSQYSTFQEITKDLSAARITTPSGMSLGIIDTTVLSRFSLLREGDYQCDTVALSDSESQSYWIDLLDRNLSSLVSLALGLDENELTSTAADFEASYRHHLQVLRKDPCAYGVLTVRREQCLAEIGFTDIFENVKRAENIKAMSALPALLASLDTLDEDKLVDELISNILAGNMYDWGSASIQQLLQDTDFDFKRARANVTRPDRFNDISVLKQRLITGVYKKVMVFVDNSGADIVLGIVPFVRYLLSKHARVVIAANSLPALNDVTVLALNDLLLEIGLIDANIKQAVENGRLSIVGGGSGSPCLDLGNVSEELISVCDGVDLVVVEVGLTVLDLIDL